MALDASRGLAELFAAARPRRIDEIIAEAKEDRLHAAVIRNELMAELAKYQPFDSHELTMRDEILYFVQSNPYSFERRLAGHITASAWIVDETLKRALLTHHRKLDRWLQLGGHADGDADVRRVALREATEESGLAPIRFARREIFDVDVHVIPARKNEPEHKHYDIRFLLIADADAPLIVSEESHELAWLPIAELDRDGIDASVRRMARKTLARHSTA
jgi:8-oxo-dGTP pyrophosphatase MutT (NUDIX family)